MFFGSGAAVRLHLFGGDELDAERIAERAFQGACRARHGRPDFLSDALRDSRNRCN